GYRGSRLCPDKHGLPAVRRWHCVVDGGGRLNSQRDPRIGQGKGAAGKLWKIDPGTKSPGRYQDHYL
ncbi:hypothetical protein GGH91_001979, partial [Coemansia sp. RSA 2671]